MINCQTMLGSTDPGWGSQKAWPRSPLSGQHLLRTSFSARRSSGRGGSCPRPTLPRTELPAEHSASSLTLLKWGLSSSPLCYGCECAGWLVEYLSTALLPRLGRGDPGCLPLPDPPRRERMNQWGSGVLLRSKIGTSLCDSPSLNSHAAFGASLEEAPVPSAFDFHHLPRGP